MNRYPQAFLHYLKEFHQTRDFFECHEILEEYWKSDPLSPHKEAWVGFIQIAVALYHERRGNRRGAIKMMRSAFLILNRTDIQSLGINREALLTVLEERVNRLSNSEQCAYSDLTIPILDPALKPFVSPAISSEGLSADIIHKHIRRDRSEVIAARLNELKKRRNQST